VSHRLLLLLTGAFVIAIGVTLLVAPGAYLRLYVTDYVSGMDFSARRFAPAVLGLGVLLLFARDLTVGRFLIALLMLTGFVFWGVAATGVHALLTVDARSTLLIAVAIEVIIGAIFLITGRNLAKSL
jgi:hypothetical protein